jgi:hypothetical protein
MTFLGLRLRFDDVFEGSRAARSRPANDDEAIKAAKSTEDAAR